MSFLEVSEISVGDEAKAVLKGITFTQKAFQNIAIAGETGSGKSTLLKVIAGLAQPESGEVIFKGQNVEGPEDKLIPGHKGIAYLSQHFELPHSLRVEQVLKYANTMPGGEAEALYNICRISHLLKRKTNELSGGERQRIALARLLSTSPSLLLLDEPFSNLDMVHKNVLKSVIRDISEEMGITCTLISHDPQDSLSWAETILVMKEGEIVQQGPPNQVYTCPLNEYVAGLFGRYNLITSEAMLKQFELDKQSSERILRPEELQIVTNKTKAVPGRVQRVYFYGSYSELEVAVADGTVVVRVTDGEHNTGDQVYVSLASGLKKTAPGV